MFKMLASVLVASQSHWPGAAAKFFVNVTVSVMRCPDRVHERERERDTVVPSGGE